MVTGRSILLALRWGVFLLACGFLVSHLRADKGMAALHAMRQALADARTAWTVAFAASLVLVNWGMESLKWGRLMRPVEHVGPWRAFVATVAGTSIGLITPNRTGEFLGRVFFLSPEHRAQGSFATALGSIAQFVVTLFAGAVALVLLRYTVPELHWGQGIPGLTIVSLTVLVGVGALVLYLQPWLFRRLLLLVPGIRKFRKASLVLARVPRRELRAVILLSACRYAVFTLQFVLLCSAFGAGLDTWTTMLVVPVIYLVSTLVPTVLLSELGVRGSLALALFDQLGGHGHAALVATTVLWTINLLIPGVVGGSLLAMARNRASR